MELIELRVPLHCDGCESKLRNALSRMIGVESVDVDKEQQKVTVMGYVRTEKVLKKVKRTVKLAKFWPFGHYNIRRHHSHQHYHHKRPGVEYWSHHHKHVDSLPHDKNYNRSHESYTGSSKHSSKHGHYSSGGEYGYEQQHYKPAVDDKATTMFSEENPNACSVM